MNQYLLVQGAFAKIKLNTKTSVTYNNHFHCFRYCDQKSNKVFWLFFFGGGGCLTDFSNYVLMIVITHTYKYTVILTCILFSAQFIERRKFPSTFPGHYYFEPTSLLVMNKWLWAQLQCSPNDTLTLTGYLQIFTTPDYIATNTFKLKTRVKCGYYIKNLINHLHDRIYGARKWLRAKHFVSVSSVSIKMMMVSLL